MKQILTPPAALVAVVLITAACAVAVTASLVIA